jgi:septation ring formation regulator EzrA
MKMRLMSSGPRYPARMAMQKTIRSRQASQDVSAVEYAALENRVTELAKALEELMVRQARTQEELTLLRHEQAARDLPSGR